jgi:hypothetical protein
MPQYSHRLSALWITNRRREAGIVAIYACLITRVDRKRSRDKNSTSSTSPSASCRSAWDSV